jgi:hypothetical protein
MNTVLAYHLALFIHILGAFGLIAAITLEAIGLRGLRQATRREEALVWLGISRNLVMRLAPASLALILVTGLYMMATAWGWQGWILAGLTGLVLLAVVGALGTGKRMARIGPAIGQAPAGAVSDGLRRTLRDPILLASLGTRLAIVLGVAFVMTVKPSGVVALVVVLLAATVGLLVSQVSIRRSSNELRHQTG